ncbi:hypothetical protein FDUTEX481_08323 [Tolypothrix sp. PCC 7601]|nr:hypothetical protein FDUTEX481_08323 [Tolypothrix sp. PCC 7601]
MNRQQSTIAMGYFFNWKSLNPTPVVGAGEAISLFIIDTYL